MAETNLTKVDDYQIYITSLADSSKLYSGYDKVDAKHWTRIPFTKYQIKESDFRVKTASFTSPMNIDLTGGRVLVRITSTKHENFIGIVLDDDYTENKDGTYSYKCQDMSREYMNKFQMISTKQTNYRILKSLLTGLWIGINEKITEEIKENEKPVWSGLRPLYKYAGSYMGNPVSLNMMAQKPKLISKNKSIMEVIRDICHAQAYVDVYFNSKGILQIKPISIKDWKETGLHLDLSEVSERQFKFDITNAITRVLIDSTDSAKLGKAYDAKNIVGLNLSAFFGKTSTETSNPSQSSSGSSKTKAVSTSSTKTTTSSAGKNGNPFNNKKKRIIVCEDKGGSSGFKSGIIKKLKADGWSVTDLGTGPGTHSKSYDILSSKYAVNLTIYNGVDPKTIDEPVTGWLKGKHEKYGVRLVQMFDSKGWNKKTGTYNKKGIFYKKHGDFRGYRVPKAHDDNFSGARSGVLIEDLHKWYVKYHSRVCYCCGASVTEAYNQFKAGGYLKMRGYVK